MSEVVWIAGVSAVGKATFIDRVAADKDIPARLGWLDKPIAPCPESLGYIGQFDDDPIFASRKNILTRVPLLLRTAEVVLLKWQIEDSQAHYPQRLKERLPNERHRIIELRAPANEIAGRLLTKPWWIDYGMDKYGTGEALVAVERKLVADCLKPLRDSFEFTVLDSGESGGYRAIEEPEQF